MNSTNELSKDKTESNQIESKDILKNVKSDYILQIFFNYLSKKKILDIIKYNKNLKDRLNISINDYKELSEIEIELKLVYNKYEKFININKENKIYYHIYLNDNK